MLRYVVDSAVRIILGVNLSHLIRAGKQPEKLHTQTAPCIEITTSPHPWHSFSGRLNRSRRDCHCSRSSIVRNDPVVSSFVRTVQAVALTYAADISHNMKLRRRVARGYPVR